MKKEKHIYITADQKKLWIRKFFRIYYKKIQEILTPRETKILFYYSFIGMNLEEIGNIFGATMERIRQIKDNAIKKLGENAILFPRLFEIGEDEKREIIKEKDLKESEKRGTCSPRYTDMEGYIRNEFRMKGGSKCSEECFFWEDCQRELSGGEFPVAKFMSNEEARENLKIDI